MKKILAVLVLVALLTSCELALGSSMPPEYGPPAQSMEYATLDCIDMFSINGKGYTHVKTALPVLVYNPNLYAVSITVDGSAILVLGIHEEKRLY